MPDAIRPEALAMAREIVLNLPGYPQSSTRAGTAHLDNDTRTLALALDGLMSERDKERSTATEERARLAQRDAALQTSIGALDEQIRELTQGNNRIRAALEALRLGMERDWIERAGAELAERVTIAENNYRLLSVDFATERVARQAAEQRADEKTQWLINAEEGYREEHEARQAAEAELERVGLEVVKRNCLIQDKDAALRGTLERLRVALTPQNLEDVAHYVERALALTPSTPRERWAAMRLELAQHLLDRWMGEATKWSSLQEHTRTHWLGRADEIMSIVGGSAYSADGLRARWAAERRVNEIIVAMCARFEVHALFYQGFLRSAEESQELYTLLAALRAGDAGVRSLRG